MGAIKRAARIRIAKQTLDMIDKGEIQTAEEPAVELDIGRFVDSDRFEKKRHAFLLDRTQLLAYTADVPEPGDYYATKVAGRPILIVRSTDGVVRAFFNTCRHRGVQLAEGRGKARAFVCPYHAWTFGLNGDLLKDRGLIAGEAMGIFQRSDPAD